MSFSLVDAAAVRFSVARFASGRRTASGACARPTRRTGRAAPCTRAVLLAGAFTRAGRQGANALRFTGRLASHRLKPGRYQLRAVLPVVGRRPRPQTIHFRIVR